MANYYDVSGGLKWSWENFRKGEVLKWTGLHLLAVFFLFAILFGLMLALVFASTDFRSMISNEKNVSGNIAFQMIRWFFSIVLAVVGLYFIPRIMGAAMALCGFRLPPRPPGIIQWGIFSITRMLLDLACFFDMKLLLPAAALLALALLSFAAGFAYNGFFLLALAMGLGAVLAYSVANNIHSIRTHFALYKYLRADGEAMECLRESHALVKGQTFEVFLAGFIGGLAMLLALLPMLVVLLVSWFINPLLCLGVGLLLGAAFFWLLTAYQQTFAANIFQYYDRMGPVPAMPAAAEKTPGAKPAAKKTGPKRPAKRKSR